jgi:coenzyme PQQ precursor peptide PqqA
MAWRAPIFIEACVGLEINGYLPPEFSVSGRTLSNRQWLA